MALCKAPGSVVTWLLGICGLLLLPWLYGLACAFLVRLTPTFRWKLRLALFLVAGPTRLYGRDVHIRVRKDVEIMVRWRYGKPEERSVYHLLLNKGG